MGEPANLKSIRLQYLVLDDTPAKLRNTRLQYIASDEHPASVRRVTGQFLTIDKQPFNLRNARLQYIEGVETPASVRRVTGQFLTIDKQPLNIRNTRLQYLEGIETPASLRRLTAQFLIRPRDPFELRAVRLQYAELVNRPPSFKLEIWPRLLAVINQNNGTTFTDAHLTHGLPKASTVPDTWNTELEITALPASGFSGTMKVFYQRYSIAELFTENFPFLDLAGKVTTHDLLPQLNALLGTLLTPEEVLPIPIDHARNTYTLTITDKSWMFIPGSSYGYHNVRDLALMYPVVDLNGFDDPNAGPGGILNAKVGVNGIYDILADDGSKFKAYVDMTTDGGYWIQTAHWVTLAPTSADQLLFGEVVVTGREVKGFSSDMATRPVITAGRIKNNKAKQWMLKHDHPGWKALFGDWQIGNIFPDGDVTIPANAPVPVKTSLGNKALYSQRSGWGMDCTPGDAFGFWTQAGNAGPCGGMAAPGPNPMCPVSDFIGNFGPHADYTYTKRLFLRATNYSS